MARLHRDEHGFILASAIVAMVVVGAAVAGSYFIANQEFHVGKSMRHATHTFYAAEAGVQQVFATWSIRDRWTMNGGTALPVGPVSLPNGATYIGSVARVDNTPAADTDTERYYVVRIEGRTRSSIRGEEVANRQVLILRVRYYDFCCSAAITAKDTFTQAGNTTIDGNNRTPANWAGQCDSASTANVAGAEVECADCFVTEGAPGTTSGDPPVETDTTLQSQTLTEWDEVTYDLLRSMASKTYPDGWSTGAVGGTFPFVTSDPATALPVCDVGVYQNWGEPFDPAHPCFNYFPILYGEGDLWLDGNSYGQGLLIVEGDLTLKGGYEFYGIILVKGHILTEGTGGKIHGSVIVAGQGDGNSRLAGNAEILYSSCAVMRAKRFAELAKKEALPLRAWIEAL
jgi:hypothetical protein